MRKEEGKEKGREESGRGRGSEREEGGRREWTKEQRQNDEEKMIWRGEMEQERRLKGNKRWNEEVRRKGNDNEH